MIDLSEEPIEENIAICKKYLERMSKIGMTLEIGMAKAFSSFPPVEEAEIEMLLYLFDGDGDLDIDSASLTQSTEVVIPLYIDRPIILCNGQTRLLIGIKAFTESTEKPSISLYFESSNPSFVRTTLVPGGPTDQ